MSLSQTSVGKLYATVIEDVISGVREYFLDEGVDEQVLIELKNSWVSRLQATKALVKPEAPEPQPPALKQPIANNQPVQQQQPQQQPQQPPQPQPQQQPQPQPQPVAPAPVPVELPKTVSIQITLPAQLGVPDAQPRAITIQVPATALQGNQLQSVLTGPIISATMALPPHMATALLQQHVTASLCGQNNPAAGIIQVQAAPQQPTVIANNLPQQSNGQTFQNQTGLTQLDGQNDTSDDDEDEEDEEDDVDDDDEDDADDKEDEENEENEGPEEEPLNSEDDVSDEDPLDLFETDNVVVCQYDKITRTRNKWKFYLKDGIMNLGGKDYVFQKSNGDAEW